MSSNSDSVQILLPGSQTTTLAGESLAATLYSLPVTVLLQGELGAGKTTFLQGFFRALGVHDPVTSPTYALEQRYTGHVRDEPVEILHLDLYRLSQAQSEELLASTEGYLGIRCIEWPERLRSRPADVVALTLEETADHGRNLSLTFEDAAFPQRDAILAWRNDVGLPRHIGEHCDAVADFSLQVAEYLSGRGQIVRPFLLKRAGELHDLLRFVDFREGASLSDEPVTDAQRTLWKTWGEKFPGLRHEAACAKFLRDRGYPELAEVIAVHGLRLPSPRRTTIEQKILFYADKRVRLTTVVSLDERFDDFAKRYGNGDRSHEGDIWLKEAKSIEHELFGGMPVF